MDDERQIVELLREIRDIHGAHLDLYREVTGKLLEANRRQDEDRRRREEASQAELRKFTRSIWGWFAIIILLILFLRPLGDRLIALFDR